MLKLNIVEKPPITQSWTICDIVKFYTPLTWENVFEDAKYELKDVSNILANQEAMGCDFFPLKVNIFRAFDYTPLPHVKVVIIGQDTYPQIAPIGTTYQPRGQGMSFSVHPTDEIPSSLKNIFKELVNTVEGFEMPDNGDLTPWARQGVLLLNSCLTVRANAPDSHGEIWYGFIKKVFKFINEINPKCIYVLWGSRAQNIKPMFGEKSICLECAHPSGRSAHRGFFGCNHFNLINNYLIEQGKQPIDWRLPRLYSLT